MARPTHQPNNLAQRRRGAGRGRTAAAADRNGGRPGREGTSSRAADCHHRRLPPLASAGKAAGSRLHPSICKIRATPADLSASPPPLPVFARATSRVSASTGDGRGHAHRPAGPSRCGGRGGGRLPGACRSANLTPPPHSSRARNLRARPEQVLELAHKECREEHERVLEGLEEDFKVGGCGQGHSFGSPSSPHLLFTPSQSDSEQLRMRMRKQLEDERVCFFAVHLSRR